MLNEQLTTEPTSKQRTDQTQKEVEIRNDLSQQPAHDPSDRANAVPTAHALKVLLVYDVCAAPDPDVDVLACDRTVDNTCDDDRRERDSESNLRDERTGGTERGAGDEWAGVVIDDHGYGHIESDGDALFEKEGLFEVARVFELGLEREESDMASYLW